MEVGRKAMGAKISTLIFMDLETTGLPCDVGKKNVHITELSFVAIDRNSFEDDKNLRALNKLSLCIRPRSVVSPGAMCVTGLYNDILENQEEFDDSVPKLFEYFFRRLQTPICLLAHNGNKFDFPVLQAELQRIKYSLGSDILCADTLVAFRSICLSPKATKDIEPLKEAEKDDEMHSKQILLFTAKHPKLLKEGENKGIHSEQKKFCGNHPISEVDIDSLLSQDMEVFADIEETLITDDKDLLESGINKLHFTNNETTSEKNKPAPPSDFLDSLQNDKTPQNRKIPHNLNGNALNVKKRKILDPTSTPKKEYQGEIRPAKRALFPEPDHLPRKITKFTLESLYSHFYNEKPPVSHYAEADCMSLSKVCQKINKDFLSWIDENSVAFCDINAMW